MIDVKTGKEVIRAGKEEEERFLPLLALSLMIKVLRKEVTRAGWSYVNMNDMERFLVRLYPFRNIKITKYYFNYKLRFNCVYSRVNLHRIKDGEYAIYLYDKQE